MPFNFTASLKLNYTPQNIMRAADRAERRILNQFGAYVMKLAVTSIRRGGKHEESKPGEVPIGHDGPLQLKRLIRFAYDPKTHAVYIGPIKANGAGLQSPEFIEYGGDEEIWHGSGNERKQIVAHYEARPFMRPAFDKAKKKFLQELIKNSIVKG